MAQTHWKSKDGIAIPLWGTPERKHYESAFKDQLHTVFGSPNHTLRKLKIPLAQLTESSGNDPVNKDRLNLYTRMARGGDRLPPVVVRRNANDTFDMIDGSHRRAAAQAAGMKGIDAYELVPNAPVLPAVKKPIRKMAIADIQPGQDQGDHFTYSHVLHPDHRLAGYTLNVHPNVYDDGSHELTADLLHNGKSVGALGGTLTNGRLKLDAASIDGPHRGKGMGLAMYEAMYAHARHGLGATHVEGEQHSTSAHAVHQKLARKHGLDYQGKLNTYPSMIAKPPGDFDAKYEPYQYALKSEDELELDKMAIKDIKPGEHGADDQLGGKVGWNYTHVLPETHQSKYRIQLQHVKGGYGDRPGGVGQDISANLFHSGPQGWEKAGRVEGYFHPDDKTLAISHAVVDEPHQRQGLGSGLYEALFAHAHNVLGATHVKSENHSSLARGAHQKLARKHGLNYASEPRPEYERQPFNGPFDNAYGSYNYALKSEDEMEKMAIADIPPGPLEKENPLRKIKSWNYTHVLPEAHQGQYRIQVQHQDASTRPHDTEGDKLHAVLFHKASQGWARCGSVEGAYNPNRKHLNVDYAAVHDAHAGRGLGLGLYEALYAHARNVLGASHVVGGEHSSIAAKAHQKLARKHGLEYSAQQVRPAEGPFDDAFGQYQYALKSEMHFKASKKAEKALAMLLKAWTPPAIAPVTMPKVDLAATSKPPTIAPLAAPKPVPVPGLQAPPAAMTGMHSTVEGFMGQLKTIPKGTPERGRFITQHMNHGPFLSALKAHPQGASLHQTLTGFLNSSQNAGFKAGGTKAVVKAEDARRLPPAEQKKLRKALRMNKAKKLRKTANLREDSPETLDGQSEIAGHMLGFQPHMHHAFKAARFLVGGEPASLEQMRRALWDHDGDHVAAALHLYGIPNNAASRKALEGHQDIEKLGKDEDAPPTPKHALAVVPASVRAANAINRAFEDGTYQFVKLNGKHSSGSMLASDPETQLAFLLKPNAGGVSPAKGVGEEPANQARREAAFWHASKLFGLQDYMPQADVVSISDSNGHTHEWAAILMLPPDWKPVEDMRESDLNWVIRCLEKYRGDGTLHQWGAMDYILGNPDRHWGNALMHDTDIKLIDQGSALAGVDFAPGSDKNSFVPFYLRYTCPTSKFNKLSLESKLRWMPSVSKDVDEMLRVWIHGIDPGVLKAVLRTYGIHPDACVARLKRLQSVEGSMSQWINRSWAAS